MFTQYEHPAMIRHELQITQLRFYNEDSDNPFQPYDAICSIVWESPKVIWIRGFHGTLTRKLLRELFQWVLSNGIEKIKAHRASGKTLPFLRHGSRGAEYSEIDVNAIRDKAAKF